MKTYSHRLEQPKFVFIRRTGVRLEDFKLPA